VPFAVWRRHAGSEVDILAVLEGVAMQFQGFVVVEADRQSCGVAADAIENGGDAGERQAFTELDVEAGHAVLGRHVRGEQAMFERPAAGLDERLLDAPQLDEGFILFPCRQVDNQRVLLGGEVVAGKPVDPLDRADALDIDAGFGMAGEGICYLVAGVRKVEPEAGVFRKGYEGFADSRGRKADAGGIGVEGFANDAPEQSSPHDEAFPVSFETKRVGPHSFIVRKKAGELFFGNSDGLNVGMDGRDTLFADDHRFWSVEGCGSMMIIIFFDIAVKSVSFWLGASGC